MGEAACLVGRQPLSNKLPVSSLGLRSLALIKGQAIREVGKLLLFNLTNSLRDINNRKRSRGNNRRQCKVGNKLKQHKIRQRLKHRIVRNKMVALARE